MEMRHVTVQLLLVALALTLANSSLVHRMVVDPFKAMPRDGSNRESELFKEEDPNFVNLTELANAPLHDPPQCKRVACPPAKLLANRGSYTKVYFPEADYAKSRLEWETMIPATMSLYKRLEGYIDGNNHKRMRIPMAAPVILRMDPGLEGMFSPKNFTLFFYIDPSCKNPPQATDRRINVLTVNSYILYIRTFSGYPVTYGDWMRELLQLAADVEADGEVFKKDYYYFASYDNPDRFTSRINEVQLLRPHPDHMGL